LKMSGAITPFAMCPVCRLRRQISIYHFSVPQAEMYLSFAFRINVTNKNVITSLHVYYMLRPI
jgi:hypothetical protein